MSARRCNIPAIHAIPLQHMHWRYLLAQRMHGSKRAAASEGGAHSVRLVHREEDPACVNLLAFPARLYIMVSHMRLPSRNFSGVPIGTGR